MREAILLNKLLGYLRETGNSSIGDVECSIEDGILISMKSSGSIKYSSSVLAGERVLYSNVDISTARYCFDSYISYLSRFKDCVLLIREGVDESTGNIVYVKVKAIKYNIDSLVLELARELDRYNSILGTNSTFVHDTHEKYIDIYPLNIDIDGLEEDIIIEVSDGEVVLDEFYDKVSLLKDRVDVVLLRCIWSLIGDYSILVKLVRNGNIYTPIMYTIFLDSGVRSLDIC